MMRQFSLWKRLLLFGSIASIMLAISALLGIMVGSTAIFPQDIFASLFSDGGESANTTTKTIIIELRLPRVLLAILVGASLALAGCGFQSIMNNPLADPYIVGTSAGASLGATLAIVLHLSSPLAYFSPIPVFAFLGALLAMVAVYNLAKIGQNVPMETFLLAGVVVGSFAGAMVSFLMTLADRDLQNVVIWLMGSLNQADMQMVWLVSPYIFIGGSIMLYLAPSLNIIAMGEDSAYSLGLNVELLKKIVIVTASLITAASVAAIGLVGFLGLFIPHIVRLIVGPDHRLLLPISALTGASFLILADLVARTIVAPRELPVGVITALIGAPCFFWLLHKCRKSSQ